VNRRGPSSVLRTSNKILVTTVIPVGGDVLHLERLMILDS
jgi:hypothetical protein